MALKNENIKFLLKDQRLCSSPKLQEFFRSEKGRRMADRLEVIRFEGQLWFVTLGWLVSIGKENGFAGLKVREAASWGGKANTGYPNWQKGGDYEVVTDWFWQKYKEQGIVSIPEVWHIKIPHSTTHAEAHCV